MIFAELDYPCAYAEVHDPLVDLLSASFSHVQAGHQGDSWIWVGDGAEKVAVDTFTSMKHQVKSAGPGPHVQRVIEALQRRFRLNVHACPEPEGHEDA